MEANKIAYMNASLIAGFFEKKFINPSRSERICIDDLKKKEKSFIWKTEKFICKIKNIMNILKS